MPLELLGKLMKRKSKVALGVDTASTTPSSTLQRDRSDSIASRTLTPASPLSPASPATAPAKLSTSGTSTTLAAIDPAVLEAISSLGDPSNVTLRDIFIDPRTSPALLPLFHDCANDYFMTETVAFYEAYLDLRRAAQPEFLPSILQPSLANSSPTTLDTVRRRRSSAAVNTGKSNQAIDASTPSVNAGGAAAAPSAAGKPDSVPVVVQEVSETPVFVIEPVGGGSGLPPTKSSGDEEGGASALAHSLAPTSSMVTSTSISILTPIASLASSAATSSISISTQALGPVDVVADPGTPAPTPVTPAASPTDTPAADVVLDRATVARLVEHYVDPKSPTSLNLSGALRKAVMEAAGKEAGPSTKQMDMVGKEVGRSIQGNLLPRFRVYLTERQAVAMLQAQAQARSGGVSV
ncbi:hypothetical protein H9P43_002572 [Blastocladiella emersonii ATCC 22665]|nr:hypothetical protein H9P43_002572 [Blastocladiella emersonii ATCC 22665]